MQFLLSLYDPTSKLSLVARTPSLNGAVGDQCHHVIAAGSQFRYIT
jgi:hypothetical protein